MSRPVGGQPLREGPGVRPAKERRVFWRVKPAGRGRPKPQNLKQIGMDGNDGRARSDIYRVADWADWVDFGGGRREVRYDREEAIKQLRRNDGIERLTSVYLVATMAKKENKVLDKYLDRKLVVEDVAFVDATEAHAWAKEMLDCEWEVVEVSIKGQT